MTRVSAAFEVSPDDPRQVAEAIARAAQGAVVHLVRDGRAVADIVPAMPQPGRALRDPRHVQISQMMAARFGAPTLVLQGQTHVDHAKPAGWRGVDKLQPATSPQVAQINGPVVLADYRRAYDSCGTSWPGDDYIRRNHPVAEVC
jgi:antitoxin (DNA-binding transcriptional repressor) of toxin-antitoxin stability system